MATGLLVCDQYDWTTGGLHDGNKLRKYASSTPCVPLFYAVAVTGLNGFSTFNVMASVTMVAALSRPQGILLSRRDATDSGRTWSVKGL